MTIELAGWTCARCGTWNSDEKERRDDCRHCAEIRPIQLVGTVATSRTLQGTRLEAKATTIIVHKDGTLVLRCSNCQRILPFPGFGVEDCGGGLLRVNGRCVDCRLGRTVTPQPDGLLPENRKTR